MIDLDAVERALIDAGLDAQRYGRVVTASGQYEEQMGGRGVETVVDVTVHEGGWMEVTRTRTLGGPRRAMAVGGVVDVEIDGESTDTTRFKARRITSVSDVLAVLQFVKMGRDRGTGTVSAGRNGHAVPATAGPGR